ncbi:MAG: hypothetical protein EA344_05675 [Alkalicoccus sp.]|nr:MAG: hypothetical protein EA344_05675 [Alkalicoccus sp.]
MHEFHNEKIKRRAESAETAPPESLPVEETSFCFFMIPISPSVKPVTGQRRLREKKAGRSPRTSGKPRAQQAKRAAGTPTSLIETLIPLKTAP